MNVYFSIAYWFVCAIVFLDLLLCYLVMISILLLIHSYLDVFIFVCTI